MEENECIVKAKNQLLKLILERKYDMVYGLMVKPEDIELHWFAELYEDYRVCLSIPKVSDQEYLVIYDSDEDKTTVSELNALERF